MTLRLPVNVLDLLNETARRRGVERSRIVRDALIAALDAEAASA